MKILGVVRYTVLSSITVAVSLIPLTSAQAQPSLPSDEEITTILVEGQEWTYDSREYCGDYKFVFGEDGSHAALRYAEGFYGPDGTWYEPSWALSGAADGSFSIENGALQLHDPRFGSTYSSSITAASPYQVDLSAEEEPRSLVNCSVSDQEFADGLLEVPAEQETRSEIEISSNQQNQTPPLNEASTISQVYEELQGQSSALPSISGLNILTENGPRHPSNSFISSKIYNTRANILNGLTIQHCQTSYYQSIADCNREWEGIYAFWRNLHLTNNATIADSLGDGALVDGVGISTDNTYYEYCFDNDNNFVYPDNDESIYMYVINIYSDTREFVARTGMARVYSTTAGDYIGFGPWIYERYVVDCNIPYEQAQDQILSGSIHSPQNEEAVAQEVRINSIDRWWATIGSDPTIDVTLKIEVPEGDYELDIDIENLNTWDVVDDSEVVIRGNGGVSSVEIGNSTGVADLGRLSAGVYDLTIQFEVPDTAIVEQVTFTLSTNESFSAPSPYGVPYTDPDYRDPEDRDQLITYFVSDHSYEARNAYHVEGREEPLSAVEELVNYFAPVLFFEEADSVQHPYDAASTYGSRNRLSNEGNEEHRNRSGDAETHIDLSDYSSQSPSEGKVYATVLENDVRIGQRREQPSNRRVQVTRREMAINYYFFYPISDWSQYQDVLGVGGYNTHEGDWEGIVIFLWLDDQIWRPYKIKYANHLGSIDVDWSEETTIDSTRPSVYVGLGGHASYPNPDVTYHLTLPSEPREGELLIETNRPEFHNGGIRWDARGKTEYIGRAGDFSSDSWLLFPGRWGDPDLDNDGSAIDGDAAPYGPIFLDTEYNVNQSAGRGERWLFPWEWPDR